MSEFEETEYKISKSTVHLASNNEVYNGVKTAISLNVEPIKQTLDNLSYQNPSEMISIPVLINLEIGSNGTSSTKSFTENSEKTPSRARFIMVLLDRSESMQREDRLINAQNSLITLIEGLGSEDQIGVISFGGSNQLILPFTKIEKSNLNFIKGKILTVQATGQTNIVAALKRANDYIEDYQNKYDYLLKNTYTIMLLSDGYDNHSEQNAMLHIRENFKNANMNFTINTFGYGSEHDAKLLSSIAQYGGGSFYYIKNQQNLLQNFQACCKGFENIIVENVELTVKIFENGLAGRRFSLVHEDLPANSRSYEQNQFTLYQKYGQQDSANNILFYINFQQNDISYSEKSNKKNKFNSKNIDEEENKKIDSDDSFSLKLDDDSIEIVGQDITNLKEKSTKQLIELEAGTVTVKFCQIGLDPIFELERRITISCDPASNKIIFPTQNQQNNDYIIKHKYTVAMKNAIEAFNQKEYSQALDIFKEIEVFIKQFQDYESSQVSQDLLSSIQYYKKIYEQNEKEAMNEVNLLMVEEATYHSSTREKNRKLQIYEVKYSDKKVATKIETIEEVNEYQTTLMHNQKSLNNKLKVLKLDKTADDEQIMKLNKNSPQNTKKSKNINVDDLELFEEK